MRERRSGHHCWEGSHSVWQAMIRFFKEDDMTNSCPCGSARATGECCGPFLDGNDRPQSAEELMRSRYTAHVLENIGYLHDTLWPGKQPSFDELAVARWAAQTRWTGLKVIAVDGGTTSDREGIVLFEARYLAGGRLQTHRERSRFRKKAGRWYYVEALPE